VLLDLADALETGVLRARPRERERGAVDRACAAAWERIIALRTRRLTGERAHGRFRPEFDVPSGRPKG